jgi:hypothetical protein
VAGEVIADRHELTVPATELSGASRLAVGMYDPPTGERLQGDSVVLELFRRETER